MEINAILLFGELELHLMVTPLNIFSTYVHPTSKNLGSQNYQQ